MYATRSLEHSLLLVQGQDGGIEILDALGDGPGLNILRWRAGAFFSIDGQEIARNTPRNYLHTHPPDPQNILTKAYFNISSELVNPKRTYVILYNND
jgi:hypothetical protein